MNPKIHSSDELEKSTPASFGTTYRQRTANLVSSSYFDAFILVAIILNSILIACVDYRAVDDNYQPSIVTSMRNNVIEQCEVVFTVVFATECLLKVIAYGFMKGRHAYIRDGWNVLDFIIVVIRYVLYESCGCLFVPLLSTNICNSCRNSFAVLLALFQVCPAPTCRCFVAFVY